MNGVVSLSASARYGYGGKQYIARITGRDSKFTFAREFVDRKSGKRRESSEYDTDEPGLYVECDIDKHGDKVETYRLVYDLPGWGLITIRVSKETAMDLAKRLDRDGPLDWTREALTLRLEWAESKDQDEEVDLGGPELDLAEGKVKRSELVAALRRALGPPPAPSADDPRAEALAAIRRLMAEHGIVIEELV